MKRLDLWRMIDDVAVAHPPDGPLRLTNAELTEWLWFVSTSLLASRETRQKAKKAARFVPSVIGPVYELPAVKRNAVTPPGPRPPERTFQPTLFDGV